MRARPAALAVLAALLAAGCAAPPEETGAAPSTSAPPPPTSAPPSTEPAPPDPPAPPVDEGPAEDRNATPRLVLEASAVRTPTGYDLRATLSNEGNGTHRAPAACAPPGGWWSRLDGPGGIVVAWRPPCGAGSDALRPGFTWTYADAVNGTVRVGGTDVPLPEGTYRWTVGVDGGPSASRDLAVDWTGTRGVALARLPGVVVDAAVEPLPNGTVRLSATLRNEGDRTYHNHWTCAADAVWDPAGGVARALRGRCPLPDGSAFPPGASATVEAYWDGSDAPGPGGEVPYPGLYRWELRLELEDSRQPSWPPLADSVWFGVARPG